MATGTSAPSIATRTLRGMGWAYGSYVGGRILVLGSTAILARLLDPDDFGLVAFAITFMAILQGLADLGLGEALVIQSDEDIQSRASSAFVSTVGLGLVLSVAIAALSPLAERFFGTPGLARVVAVLGLNFFLQSLGATHYALAQRSLNFRARTIAEFADVVVRGSVGIVLALTGFGVWSLVFGYLIGTVSLDVTLWLMTGWRPDLRIRRADLRALMRFGAALSGVSIIGTLIGTLDNLFVGRALGATALGLYALGFRLPELLIMNLSLVAGQVLYPAFSAVDRSSLGRAYLVSLRYTAMIGLPVATGMAILAGPFVVALFGAKWTGSVMSMRLLTIYALGVTLGIPAGTAYKATGRAGVLLVLGLVKLALLVAGLLLFVDRGIEYAAASQAVSAGVIAVVGITLAARLLGVGIGSIWRELWPSALALVPTAIATGASLEVFSGVWPQLLVGGAGGAVLYVATISLLAPDQVAYVRERIRHPKLAPVDEPVEVRTRDAERVP